METKKKLMSLLLALVMIVGTIIPAMAAEGDKESDKDTNLVIHKILMKDINGWPKPANPDGTQPGITDDQKYDGSEIKDIEAYFGKDTKEIAGVTFYIYKIKDKETFETLKANSSSYDTKKEMDDAQKTGKPLANKIDGEVKTVKTEDNGATVNNLAKGYYWVVEDQGASRPDGSTLSNMAAVPIGLDLPYIGKDGKAITNLHVYPKNTEINKPKTDKDIKDHKDDLTITTNDPQGNKIKTKYKLGDDVPFQIATEVPAGARYQTAAWTDQMTEGLTLKADSFVVKIGNTEVTKDTHYTVSTENNGFNLELTEEGLKLINDKDAPVTILVKYYATIDKDAKVDRQDANHVSFHYGNNPNHGNTPVPNKPDNGKMTATKTMADGTDWPQGDITLTLYDAHTNQKVGESKTVNKDNPTAVWEGLDNDRQYYVKETYVDGFAPIYGIDGNGQITIKNTKNDNPPPITPEPPKVVTGGHRFFKHDGDKKALAGAGFIVKVKSIDGDDAAAGKFLAKKSADDILADQTAYDAAEKAYQDAVKANSTDVAEKKAERDKAYKQAQTEWKYVDSESDATEITSGTNGYFKLTGVAYGNYTLIEKTVPTGHAKINDIDFTVANGSMGETTIEDGLPKGDGLTTVLNQKLTIPQTGGIGTVIFGVVGIALMAGAVVAMRKRSEA